MVCKLLQYLKDSLKKKKKIEKHLNCDICSHLPDRFSCSDRFLVYKFTCKYCNDFYIGETSRPFKCRYKEHNRSLNFNDEKSALSCHAKVMHSSLIFTIKSFDLDILSRWRTPVETRLAEARAIDHLRPQLNRKF